MFQTVYTLLCEKDLKMAMVTLPRILKILETDQRFVVLDDGSLTQVSIDKLTTLSENLSVITRSEREEFILKKIRNYPELIKFREEIPLAFKIIDIPLIAKSESPRFTYTDSDIIYSINSKPYFNRNVNTYLRTDNIKLSVKIRLALLKYKWSIPFKFNSGYFSYHVKDYDLNLLSSFVSLPDVRNIHWLIEQTGWALLFGKAGDSFCPSEEQFVCRENFEGPCQDTLAIHLIANLKGKLNEWSNKELNSNKEPVFDKGRNINLFDWAKKTCHRLISL